MSRRDPTLCEAIAAGHDCSAFGIYASVRPFYAVSDVSHDEIEAGYPISCDSKSDDLNCRAIVPLRLKEFRFRLELNERASKSRELMDAIHISTSGIEPFSRLVGFDTLVSERARDELAPHVGSECEFVPAEVRDVPGEWFVMWVTKLIDPVDVDHSKLEVSTWHENGEELLKPRQLRFRSEVAEAKYLFRLSAWRYLHDADMCRPAFIELARSKRLSGFSWIAGGGTGPFVRI